jgi:hypothetical protein
MWLYLAGIDSERLRPDDLPAITLERLGDLRINRDRSGRRAL